MAKRKRPASKAARAAKAAAEKAEKVISEDEVSDVEESAPAKKATIDNMNNEGPNTDDKEENDQSSNQSEDESEDSDSSSSSSEEEAEGDEKEAEGDHDEGDKEDNKDDPILHASSKNGPKLIVVLEEANLEAVKSNRGSYELLNCDDHLHLHKKLKRNPVDSRPDIAHQCLLMLLDSPLNKAGLLQVYMKTSKGILIQINPHLRIPRTYKRFAGLMVQLLHKFKIRAVDGPKSLLEVIKNPVTRKLPTNARIIGADVNGTLVDIQDFVAALPDEPVVFVLGAMARGNVKTDYIEEMISFSEYPLSAACAISRLTGAFERKYGIL